MKGVVIIPRGFGKKIERTEGLTFQILVDGTDNNSAQVILGYLISLTQSFYEKLVGQEINRVGIGSITQPLPVEAKMQFLYNPELKSSNFVVPGLIAMIMMIIGTLLTALTIAGEWEKGTMEQLLYSPVKPLELVLGKIAPYFLISIVQMTLVLLTAIVVFNIPFRGSLVLFYFASALFLSGLLGLGLFISTISKTQQISAMIAFLTTFLPSFLLSNFVFPISSMPFLIRIITYLVPAKYFLEIIRGVFLKGAGFAELGMNFLAMTIFTLFFVTISVVQFKKRLV